jgi:hypothetical protein
MNTWADFARKGVAMTPKVSNASLGHLASHARIAIQIGKNSREVGQMAQRTRNKIAQERQAALRLFPRTL